MKNYFCVNKWVSNEPYFPTWGPSALVEIEDNLDFNVGDQIFPGHELFLKLHEAAKDFIKKFYNVDTVTFKVILDIISEIDNLNYLDIMFDVDTKTKLGREISTEDIIKSFKEKYIDGEDDDSYSKEEPVLIDFFFTDLYDITKIIVSDVIYDLGNDSKIFVLEIKDVDY